MNDSANVIALKPAKCPNCNKPANVEYRPFCSKRCADVDLGKWLNESYRIPSDQQAGLDDDGFGDE